MISESDRIKTNSLSTRVFAARPKTFTDTVVPVMIGTARTQKLSGGEDFRVTPTIFCSLFVFLMQIGSSFTNDYFDCLKGSGDRTTRSGPKRACSEGWITLPAIRIGLVITSLLASPVGIPPIFHGGWEMILVGAAYILLALLYTTHFSYLGLDDVLVLVSLGTVPIVFTIYVILPNHSQVLYFGVIISGVIRGLAIDTLLVVNNYRGRENDERDGKTTLTVRIGEKEAEKLRLVLGLMTYLQMLLLLFSGERNNLLPFIFVFIIFIPYGALHYKTTMQMKLIKKGKELNVIST